VFGSPALRRIITSAPRLVVRQGEDGSVYLEHPDQLFLPAANLVDLLNRSTRKFAASPFIHERSGEGWTGLTYAEFGQRVAHCAERLLNEGVRDGDVVALLARNSIAHAVANFAVMAIGGIATPLSPAYAAHAGGESLLHNLCDVAGVRLVLHDGAARVPQAAGRRAMELAEVVLDAGGGLFDLERAARGIDPAAGAKILFTSGSSGAPKALLNTHAMLTASAAMAEAVSIRLPDEAPPVLVDWLPWHHTFGGNINMHVVMLRGGALFIDGGAPTDVAFGESLRNLADVQPTSITNVPSAYPMLVAAMEQDRRLARRILKNEHYCSFGGAALSPAVVAAFQRVAVKAMGKRVFFTGGYGMTETGGVMSTVYWPADRTDLLGLPAPGCRLKLAAQGAGRSCRWAECVRRLSRRQRGLLRRRRLLPHRRCGARGRRLELGARAGV